VRGRPKFDPGGDTQEARVIESGSSSVEKAKSRRVTYTDFSSFHHLFYLDADV